MLMLPSGFWSKNEVFEEKNYHELMSCRTGWKHMEKNYTSLCACSKASPIKAT